MKNEKNHKAKICLFYDLGIPEQKKVYDAFCSVGRKNSLLVMQLFKYYLRSGGSIKELVSTDGRMGDGPESAVETCGGQGVNEKEDICLKPENETYRGPVPAGTRQGDHGPKEQDGDSSIGTDYKNMIISSVNSMFGN